MSEGGHGLAWLDVNGRKRYGQMWVGGVWTGASHLARDAGSNRVAGVYAYAAAAWQGGGYDGPKAELRLAELLTDETRSASPRDRRFGKGWDRPLLVPDAPPLTQPRTRLPMPAASEPPSSPGKPVTLVAAQIRLVSPARIACPVPASAVPTLWIGTFQAVGDFFVHYRRRHRPLEYRRQGDRRAFEELVHRYEKELFGYLRHYLGDAEMAEDVFQQTFLQVHLKCGQFEVERKVRPWLYAVATNQAIDCQRRNWRHRMASLDRPVLKA